MVEHDALIDSFEHLHREKREKDALHMLHKIASLVKPIMRDHSWRVGTLAEFYPEQPNLLGLNINKGQKICVRLRYPGDKHQFMPLESIVDTMLHELTHNIFGPHDDKFKALNNKLRHEYEALISKGYSGEGFLGNGQRLGGKRIPMHEMRRQAHVQAQKRRDLQKGSGQRLGSGRPNAPRGSPVLLPPRHAAAMAAIKRASINDKCASHDNDVRKIAEQASKDSRRSGAAHNQHNDEALREQALWDLVRQEEADKAGVPDWSEEEEGLNWDPESGLSLAQPGSSKPSHVEDTVPNSVLSGTSIPGSSHTGFSGSVRDSYTPFKASISATWNCPICTLDNPINFLCCDACGIERPQEISDDEPDSPSHEQPARKPPSAVSISRTSTIKTSATKTQTAAASQTRAEPRSLGWSCRRCGAFMEHKWWTCSTCGLMKDSSAG